MVWNMIFTFSIQLGMSSSQLTFTPSFFRGVGRYTTNQLWLSYFCINGLWTDQQQLRFFGPLYNDPHDLKPRLSEEIAINSHQKSIRNWYKVGPPSDVCWFKNLSIKFIYLFTYSFIYREIRVISTTKQRIQLVMFTRFRGLPPLRCRLGCAYLDIAI